MIFAHIAGIPVEETLLGFGPFALLGAGAFVRSGLTRLRRRPPAAARREEAGGERSRRR